MPPPIHSYNFLMFLGARKLGLLLGVILCVNACSLFQDDDEATANGSELYALAKGALLNGNYTDAVNKYEELEIKHPFHAKAQTAMLELAYAYYKNSSPLLAEEKIAFFVKQYPNDPRLAYAYYLKGLSHYNYATSILYSFINFDRSDKDPQPLIDAFNTFSYLISNYPDSPYVDSANRYLLVIRNTLAVYEIKVANYYFQRKAYVATVNRIKYMLEHYSGAQHTPDGLLLMAEAYRRLGMKTLARDTRRVLALNFPTFANKRLKRDGSVRPVVDEGWFSGLKDSGDTALETLDLKNRY